ncbi:stress response small protein YobI, partial [Escherichia coli]
MYIFITHFFPDYVIL